MNTANSIDNDLANLETLEAEGTAAFRDASSADAVEAARIEFLGQKQGRIKTAQERLRTIRTSVTRRLKGVNEDRIGS